VQACGAHGERTTKRDVQMCAAMTRDAEAAVDGCGGAMRAR
jgi:hypothetical protein